MSQPKIYYFAPHEFKRGDTNWYHAMSPRLLVLLDTFRHLTGTCIISPNKDAIGRRTKIIDGYYDAHNYVKHGEVQAVDVFPYLSDMDNETLQNKLVAYDLWIETAIKLNFKGVGFYPHWKLNGKQRAGLHLDVREDAEPGSPVLWGRIGNEYVSLDKAMEVLA